MQRLHVIAISILLGAGAAVGAAAAIKTVHLGVSTSAAKTARLPDRTIASRHAKLLKWSESLKKASKAHPPVLPAVPQLPHVSIPAVPSVPQQVVAAAVAVRAPKIRHVVKHRVITLPPKHVVVPAAPAPIPDPQVTYVQPPPVIEYQQADTSSPSGTQGGGHSGGDDSGEQGDGSGNGGDHGGSGGGDGGGDN